MSELSPRRRVLLAASKPALAECRQLFQVEVLRDWQTVETDSLERARFLLQLDPCDVLLLDGSLYRRGHNGDLVWLVTQRRAPVLYLADIDAETVAAVLRQGARYWLQRQLALRHPSVLAVMLRQAAEFGDLQRRGDETAEALEDSRRQVNRLVNLLWEAVPGEGRTRWFTQRHVLERLEEEVLRTQRYGGPLSIVLGEVDAMPSESSNVADAGQAATWVVDRISRVKRRSDVAGQYGLQGFMLLLPQTAEAGALGCRERLRAMLEPSIAESSPFGGLRVHFGIAGYSDRTRSVKQLLSRAEEQLERAKLEGDRGHVSAPSAVLARCAVASPLALTAQDQLTAQTE